MTTTKSKPSGSKGKRKAEAKPDVCRLTLTIRGENYGVRVIDAAAHEGEDVLRMVRLRKSGSGESYHVASHRGGTVSCECGDYHFRNEGEGTLCKHGRACKASKLI